MSQRRVRHNELDRTFEMQPPLPGSVRTLQPLGNDVLVGGSLHPPIVRLDGSGVADEDFPSAPISSLQVQTRCIEVAGRILVGRDNGLIPLTFAGELDESFWNNLEPLAIDQVKAIRRVGVDRILVSARWRAPGVPHRRPALFRLLSDGTVDPEFTPFVPELGYVLAIDPQGDDIVIGGTFHQTADPAVAYLARLSDRGVLDPQFRPVIQGEVSAVLAGAEAGGSVVFAGSFTHIHGVERRFLARVFSNGELDPTFLSSPDDGPSHVVSALARSPVSGATYLVGGGFVRWSGRSTRALAVVHIDGTLERGFSLPGLYAARTFAFRGSQTYVGGEGTESAYLARLFLRPRPQTEEEGVPTELPDEKEHGGRKRR